MSPEALVGVCIFALATGGWIMHLQAALNDARRDLDELFETRATRVELELVLEELEVIGFRPRRGPRPTEGA